MAKKEERKKKLKEQLSQIRQQGAELEEALQNQKERKGFAKMVEEERARRDAKTRTFASPKTGDEAEPDLPPLEQLAYGYNLITPDDVECKIMTKEEILNSGTLLQKIRLLISYSDLNSYFEAKEKLSNNEKLKILSSIQTPEDKELFKVCVMEYNTITNFGKLLSYFFKRFQTSYAILAVLLNKWDGYEYTAKQLTLLYNSMKNDILDVWEENKETGEPINVKTVQVYPSETIYNILNDLLYSNILDGSTLNFNKKKENFYIDVDEKGGLYSQILEASKNTTKDLSDFKAYTIVAEDYIKNSTLKYIPISIKQSVENAKEERYTRFLVKNLNYFRSDLNQRIARGETVTRQDKQRAVIPDFYEVKPSKNVLADCKAAIKDM